MTQGIVSIVQGGHVILKIIVGCNGYNAEALAQQIRGLNIRDIEQVKSIAKCVGFGCPDCLVIMDSERIESEEEVGPLFRQTFDQPTFNPRWECGLVEHAEIVIL